MTIGKLLVLAGPSGVGKGTLLRLFLQRNPHWSLSISATTRSPREGEIEGKNYYYVTQARFKEMIAKGELLEWAQYTTNYYGTPRHYVTEKLKAGQSVILEIELEGARQIKKTCPTAKQIFILPPSIEELEKRIRNRGTDSEESIAHRLERAKIEIAAAHEFDLTIVNDNLESCVIQLEQAVMTI